MAPVSHPLGWAAICTAVLTTGGVLAQPAEPPHSAELDRMIVQQAHKHGVPEKLVRRVVMRESRYNPQARNHKYWGLMQISYPTAKSMGFTGSPQELLNPLVNLTYAVPYLANAFIIAGKREDAAVRLYAAGYYDTAKRRGLLGMLRTATSRPVIAQPEDPQVASTAPIDNNGVFGSLFGSGQQAQAPASQAQVASVQATAPPPLAAPSQPQAAALASVAADKTRPSDNADMVANKRGELGPPKKWQKDGGVTVIARGEQSVTAASGQANGASEAAPSRKTARGAVRKSTLFASLDTPPTNAQAYSTVSAAASAESQTAIDQATAGRPASAVQPSSQTEIVDGRTAAAMAATAEASGTKDAAADKPEASRKTRMARKERHGSGKTRLSQHRSDVQAVAAQTTGESRPENANH